MDLARSTPPLFSRKGGVARELMRRERTSWADRHSSGTLVRHLRTSPGVSTGQRSPNPLPIGRQCRWLRADLSSCISGRSAILSSRARVGVAGCVRTSSYLLIPPTDTAISLGGAAPARVAGNLSDGQRDALARAFERTVLTCELLVTYAVGVAGKPCLH